MKKQVYIYIYIYIYFFSFFAVNFWSKFILVPKYSLTVANKEFYLLHYFTLMCIRCYIWSYIIM